MNKLGAAFGPIFMRNPDGKAALVQNEVCRSIITHYEAMFIVCVLHIRFLVNNL